VNNGGFIFYRVIFTVLKVCPFVADVVNVLIYS